MTVEEALAIIDTALETRRLNNVQELIFRQAWLGLTYSQIAANFQYHPDYIREVGSQFWQLLSQAFHEKINKNNFKTVLRHYQVAVVSPRPLLGANLSQADYTSTVARIKGAYQYNGWEEAVDVSSFCGRTHYLAMLEEWIVQKHCRLVGIFGIGGVGKTALAAKLAQQVRVHFEHFIWRSLHNAPPLESVLDSLLQFLSNSHDIYWYSSDTLDEKIGHLLSYLHSSSSLLIFDNVEAIFQISTRCGRYREGYEGYGQLFKKVGEIPHRSSVVVTSREKPKEFVVLEGNQLPVKSLELSGLHWSEGRQLFQLKGNFTGCNQNWQRIVDFYGGNPLALTLVAATVQELFDADVDRFIRQEKLIFDDVCDLLNEQFARLSRLEKEVAYWLAIAREPISLENLQKVLLPSIPPVQILESVKSLKRRFLVIETSEGWTQQPVVMEYVIKRLVEQVTTEISDEQPEILSSHALIQPKAKDSVKDNHIHFTVKSVAENLTRIFQENARIEVKFKRLIERLRNEPAYTAGYAVGNLINLIEELHFDLSNYDLSHLFIRGAGLQNTDLHQVILVHIN